MIRYHINAVTVYKYQHINKPLRVSVAKILKIFSSIFNVEMKFVQSNIEEIKRGITFTKNIVYHESLNE